MANTIGYGKISISNIRDREDTFNVILSQESFTLSLDSECKLKQTTKVVISVDVHKGYEKIDDFTIENIPSENNIVVAINNNTKTISFTAQKDTLFGISSDSFSIPITIMETNECYTKTVLWNTTIDGVNARTYFITPSASVIKKGTDNALTPNLITFNAYYRDGNTAQQLDYEGRLIIEHTLDGEEYVVIHDTGIDSVESFCTFTPNPDAKSIRCTLLAAYSEDQLDIQSVAILTDIDNAQPGSRNLVIGSATIGVIEVVSPYSHARTEVKDSGALSGVHLELKCTSAGSGFKFPNVFKKTADRIGNTYIWSLWLKCSSEKTLNTIGHLCGGTTSITVGTEWTKFSYSWKFTDESNDAFVLYGNYEVGDIMYIKDYQIEEGNIAGSWKPAPEDTDEKINKVQTSLEETTEGFNQQVSSFNGSVSSITQTQEKIQEQIGTSNKAIENINNVVIPSLQKDIKDTGDLVNTTIKTVDSNTDLIAKIDEDLKATVTQVETSLDGVKVKFATIGLDEETKVQKDIKSVTWIGEEGIRVSNRDPSNTTERIAGKTTLITADSFSGYSNDGTVTGDGDKIIEFSEDRVYTKLLECEKGMKVGSIQFSPCEFDGVYGFTITRPK